jgi:hypothetical protein
MDDDSDEEVGEDEDSDREEGGAATASSSHGRNGNAHVASDILMEQGLCVLHMCYSLHALLFFRYRGDPGPHRLLG